MKRIFANHLYHLALFTSLLCAYICVGFNGKNNSSYDQISRDKTTFNEDSSAVYYLKVKEKILNEHPRCFINSKRLGDVKLNIQGENSAHFKKNKTKIDGLLSKPIVFKDSNIVDGQQSKDHEYGFVASEAALLFLTSDKQEYLDYTKRVLVRLGEYYNYRNSKNLNIHWYAYSRICALVAYDWIYPQLSPAERIKIGTPLLNAMKIMVHDGVRKDFFRENKGDYKSGYYGPPALAWYTGLVFYKTGIDDKVAEQFLKKGFEEHWKLIKYRSDITGDDGGAATAVLAYCLEDYPWAEFNFFHTLGSSTGIDLTDKFAATLGLLNYVEWNWLPGKLHFGYGDDRHFTNKMPLDNMYTHLSQIQFFYGKKHPEIIPAINRLSNLVTQQERDVIPFIRYLINKKDQAVNPSSSSPLSEKFPLAMHFENMGQIFMRSGRGVNDTYATFTAGGILTQHRHYDNNNFVIYRNGFRAMDTGTRPQPGQHLNNYYCRTVAHNSILIRMPGEEFPKYWGTVASTEEFAPVPNDGGQRSIEGSAVVGYDHNDQYVYIAADATKCYHSDKAKEVVRQFVYIKPDIFIVFDRVESKNEAFPKTWLLHTASEPQLLDDNTFVEGSNGGKLFCQTIFPNNIISNTIGGLGKQFWSDGRNWPLPVLNANDYTFSSTKTYVKQDTIAMLGQWRVEVSPATKKLKDTFLHLIQVGNSKLSKMVATEAIVQDNKKGVRFKYLGKIYEVLFTENGAIGGNIQITEGGKQIVSETFTHLVKPQKSIF